MLDSLFLFLEPKLWMNLSLKHIFQMSAIMHQTWTNVQICQICDSFLFTLYM